MESELVGQPAVSNPAVPSLVVRDKRQKQDIVASGQRFEWCTLEFAAVAKPTFGSSNCWVEVTPTVAVETHTGKFEAFLEVAVVTLKSEP